jgi:hypothetical protein
MPSSATENSGCLAWLAAAASGIYFLMIEVDRRSNWLTDMQMAR